MSLLRVAIAPVAEPAGYVDTWKAATPAADPMPTGSETGVACIYNDTSI
jgi:hypothetical protein